MVCYLTLQEFTESGFLVKGQSEHIEISGDVLREQVALLNQIILYFGFFKVKVEVSVEETIIVGHFWTRSIL